MARGQGALLWGPKLALLHMTPRARNTANPNLPTKRLPTQSSAPVRGTPHTHVMHVHAAYHDLIGHTPEPLAGAATRSTNRLFQVCDACVKRENRHRGDHTYRRGECRHASEGSPQDRAPRVPHEPITLHHGEPTVVVRAAPGGVELGATEGRRPIAVDFEA